MTWPMHDAGSTTPDPGPEEARRREPWHEEPWHEEPWHEEPWHEEPWPDEPEPGDDGPPRRGRHAAPDPLPPLEGPMPGGGPSPAETTLPLALGWPAPPARPPRVPTFIPSSPPDSVDAPPGWRRVPRPTGYQPLDDLRPRYPQPGYGPPPEPPGGPASPVSYTHLTLPTTPYV